MNFVRFSQSKVVATDQYFEQLKLQLLLFSLPFDLLPHLVFSCTYSIVLWFTFARTSFYHLFSSHRCHKNRLNRYHLFLNVPMESVYCGLVQLTYTHAIHYSKKVMRLKS